MATRSENIISLGFSRENIPNIITASRLLAIPAIAYLLLADMDRTVWSWVIMTLFVYIISSLSDWFDGRIARKYGWETKFGAEFDQVTDKVYILAIMFMLFPADLTDNVVIKTPVYVILAREIFITLGRLYKKVPSSQIGKWKTTLQMLAVGFLVASIATIPGYPSNTLNFIGTALLVIAAILAVVSGYGYCRAIFPRVQARFRT